MREHEVVSDLGMLLERVISGSYSIDDTASYMELLLEHPWLSHPGSYLAAFLAVLQTQDAGIEVAQALIDVIFSHDAYEPLSHCYGDADELVCVAGSGKKSVKTLNISTVASLTAVAMGVKVVKPVSTGVTSLLGSSDLLRQLGIDPCANLAEVTRSLDMAGICFVAIENLIPCFDGLYGGRQLTVSPLSYALPALMTPLRCSNVLYGFGGSHPERSATLLGRYGCAGRISIVTTRWDNGYVDELLPVRGSEMYVLQDGCAHVARPATHAAGASVDGIRTSGDPEADLRIIREFIGGRIDGAYAAAVLLNAAAMAFTVGQTKTLEEGVELAQRAVSSGQLARKVERMRLMHEQRGTQ